MAITRTGSTGLDVWTAAATTHSFSHTVPSGTDLLLVFCGTQASAAVSGSPSWGATTLSTIGATTSSGANADVAMYARGIVSPTPGTQTLTWAWNASREASWCTCHNFVGTETSSIGAAVAVLDEAVDNAGSENTSVFSSSGTSGNALVFAGMSVGADSTPASNNASFTSVANGDTGGGAGNNDDYGFYVAELLTGLPSAITATWAATDESAALLLQLVAASAVVTSSEGASNRGAYRGMHRGNG